MNDLQSRQRSVPEFTSEITNFAKKNLGENKLFQSKLTPDSNFALAIERKHSANSGGRSEPTKSFLLSAKKRLARVRLQADDQQADDLPALEYQESNLSESPSFGSE